MTDYTSDDIKNICTFKQTAFNSSMLPEDIGKVVQISQILNNDVNKEKLFGARGSPWQFNLRDLMRFAQGVSDSTEGLIFRRYLKLIFVERFRLPQDRQFSGEIIKKVFAEYDENSLDTPNTLEISKF